MSMNGGYMIFDFSGKTFTSGTASTVAGVSAKVRNPYNKPTLISGLVVGSVAYPDFFAPFVEDSDSYEANVSIGDDAITISINDDDEVTVTVA